MARQRRDTTDLPPQGRPLRIVASGTLFLTHTLSLHAFPSESEATRAQSVVRTRGGSASNVLSALAQFPAVDAMLVAPLGVNEEGRMLMHELENEGVSTKYCKIWEGASAPSAWVLQADDTGSRTVINHNPLPDITHEEFVGLLGPLLVPENYIFANPSSPGSAAASAPSPVTSPLPSPSTASPAPFDWLHFEGRSVKTTLNNIVGIDGLARERKWRSHCVFSLDVSRKSRQGVEALIPHVDVVFFSKQYALSQSANYTTPRPFLLSLTALAAPHALLVVHWGASGAALLSVPTREYFQSSGWVDDADTTPAQPALRSHVSTDAKGPPGAGMPDDRYAVGSVRSGSGFWATGHRSGSGTSSSAYTAFSPNTSASPQTFEFSDGEGDPNITPHSHSHFHSLSNVLADLPELARGERDADGDADSQGTETARLRRKRRTDDAGDALDDAGAQDAFVAGMIYALSRRLVPGAPYTPSARGAAAEPDRGRWKLEDCLRFASEMAGRKARRKGFGGLMEDMTRAGWFDT